MVRSAKQLLVFVLFLCGQEDAVLSHTGRCIDDRCLAVFLKPTDHAGAQKSCQDFSGQLLQSNSTMLAAISDSLPSGEFWLQQEGAVAAPQTCSSIAVSTPPSFTPTRAACHRNLTGFLCQYALQDPCDELNPAGGSGVLYSAPMDFEVRNSHTFPQGATARAIAAGSKHLESVFLCFARTWLKAPWNCEVMNGGCEHGCNNTASACTCPAGQSLNRNGVTCEGDPCAHCAQLCRPEGDAVVCACEEGYRLKPDGEGCQDVDECEGGGRCTRADEVCVNVEGGFECNCRDGFVKEEGACLNNSICFECEHMCVKPNGVYECTCLKGFQVRARDPTKCDRHCGERQCTPICDRNSGDHVQCYCPVGYILDQGNGSSSCIDIDECEMGEKCDHACVNTFGSFRCSCPEGFILHDESKCSPVDDGGEEEEGSASTTAYPLAATAQPALVPSYVKAGSVLGIAVFVLLGAALTFFLIQNSLKRCRRFDLAALKHPNINIFHLQQVNTETYKRLSF